MEEFCSGDRGKAVAVTRLKRERAFYALVVTGSKVSAVLESPAPLA